MRRQSRRSGKHECDAGDAGRPADPIEYLTEYRSADDTASEVTGGTMPLAAPRSAVAARLTKPVAVAAPKNAANGAWPSRVVARASLVLSDINAHIAVCGGVRLKKRDRLFFIQLY